MQQANWLQKFHDSLHSAEHASSRDVGLVYLELAEHYRKFGERVGTNSSVENQSERKDAFGLLAKLVRFSNDD